MRERYYLRDQKVEIRLQMHIALFLVGKKLYVGNCSRAAAQASCTRMHKEQKTRNKFDRCRRSSLEN